MQLYHHRHRQYWLFQQLALLMFRLQHRLRLFRQRGRLPQKYYRRHRRQRELLMFL
jgi:hypothetical protein